MGLARNCGISSSPSSRPIEKPPVFSYNYESITLTEAAVANPGVAYPLAVARTVSGLYIPRQPITIVGLWLASSIVNPAAVDSGVFVGKVKQNNPAGAPQASMSDASGIYFQHISRSDNTISRTGGLAFGEQSGLYLGSGEAFGVYLSGSDAGLEITYALTITYITAFVN